MVVVRWQAIRQVDPYRWPTVSMLIGDWNEESRVRAIESFVGMEDTALVIRARS